MTLRLGPQVVEAADPSAVRSFWAAILGSDVEGNEFCAFPEPSQPARPTGRVLAVCTDSERPEELAAWWAPRVGAEIRNGPTAPRDGCTGRPGGRTSSGSSSE